MKSTRALLLLLAAACSPALAQSRPAITGIAFVRMYAAAAGPTDLFYGKTLGYQKAPSLGDNIDRYGVNPSQWLEVQPLPAEHGDTRLPIVAFTTRDTGKLERYLTAHKVALVQKIPNVGFTVHDPEGNLIEFVQQGAMAGKLPLSPRATSHRIIHAGFMVASREAEDAFFRDILGFRVYWYGGQTDGAIDYVSMQVPDGTDWIEYMLHGGANPSPQHLGVMNHFSLGTTHMADVLAGLARNACEGPNCTKTQIGRDGKVQLNLIDPDYTRVEYMEYQPSATICCSTFKGTHPTEVENQ